MFKFPYTNLHELNLDWILSVVKEATDIFKHGEADIQHAVETSEQALETAEQAAQGVVADGAVTIPKLNDDVLKMFAYVVSGRINELPIPKDSFVIVRLSTIPSVSDGLYQAVADIPANTILTDLDLKQPTELGHGTNNVLQQICNAIESGLLVIVDGDTASSGVPAGGLAFIKNNEHGLATGFYTNSSGSTFPTSGGTADSSAFTRVFDILNNLKTTLNVLNGEVGTVENSMAIIINGNTADVNVSKGQYVLLKNSAITGKTDGLYIYNSNTAKSAGVAFVSGELDAVNNGGFNDLKGLIERVGVGVTLNATGNANFTHEATHGSLVNGIYCVNFVLKTTQEINANTELNIGTVSVPPKWPTGGCIVNNGTSALVGSIQITTNGNIYINLTTNVVSGRDLVLTAVGPYY